jgi:16S rRNA (guanine1207-N2)-methyltransferase
LKVAVAMSHYFDREPTGRSDERTVEVTLPDLAFTMTTDRGVFSHGRLDTGTSLLLRTAPPTPPSGHLLDLGCGAGPIALTMAQRSPGATVHAVDVNARARRLCARNAAALGLTNVQVTAPEDVDPDLQFAAIWSNPPIRIGKAALHELLTTWLARLTPDGTAVLVVQRHLGADSLQQWLDRHGHPTTRLASRAGFRVLGITT